MESVQPQWLYSRWGSANLVPFPEPEDKAPTLRSNYLVHRVIYGVGDGTAVLDCDESLSPEVWLCTNTNYSYQDLHSKARNQTRRAARENVKIVKMSWNESWQHLLDAAKDTLLRQNRQEYKTVVLQLKSLRSADENSWGGDFVEIWAAQRDGEICGFILGFRHASTYYFSHAYSFTKLLKWNPNNYLVFTLTERAFKELECTAVNYGINGFDEFYSEGLKRFKRRMGFRLVPCNEKIICSPILKRGIKYSGVIVEKTIRIWPSLAKNSFLRTLAGLQKRIY